MAHKVWLNSCGNDGAHQELKEENRWPHMKIANEGLKTGIVQLALTKKLYGLFGATRWPSNRKKIEACRPSWPAQHFRSARPGTETNTSTLRKIKWSRHVWFGRRRIAKTGVSSLISVSTQCEGPSTESQDGWSDLQGIRFELAGQAKKTAMRPSVLRLTYRCRPNAQLGCWSRSSAGATRHRRFALEGW